MLLFKGLGCLAYYFIYFDYYTGDFLSDSASTMHDAKIIYQALPNHVADFFRIIFGLHSESETDPLYEVYFKNIDKWGRLDVTTEFFLNDNRTPIRLNAVIMLFSFGNYAVHAFVMLVLSFIGQWAFYKTFKSYFQNKEILLALIIFLTPSVLFWTSGVLKEPIAMCLMGLFLYTFLKLFIHKQLKIKYVLILLISTFFFLILKPYILILLLLPLTVFALVQQFKIKRVLIFYISFLLIVFSSVFFILKFVFNKDVVKTIVIRQNDFINLSHGGTFFYNGTRYLRLDHVAASTQYDVVDKEKKLYRIKPHVSLMYWNFPNVKDTIFVTDNQDTSVYTFISSCAPSGSAIAIDRLEYSVSSFAKIIPQSFFNVLCRPFFLDAHSVLELVASLENLLFLALFIVCFIYRSKIPIDRNLLWLCVFTVLLSFLLIGLTTTVMGAIVRYKVPFMSFLLMIPLLYLDPDSLSKIPFIKRFFINKS